MRAQIISENLEFTRGQDSKRSLGIGVLKDIEKPKNLALPVRYESGMIVDKNGQLIMRAVRSSNETPLQPYERDDLVKTVVKLLNWAYGVREVQESYDFMRGQDSKKSLHVGKIHDDTRKFHNIPETLFDDWFESAFTGTGIIYAWNEEKGQLEIGRVPRSDNGEMTGSKWNKYMIESYTLDELITELTLFDDDRNNPYNEETGEWE